MIIRRMRRDPQREGALKRAINNDFNARLSRDIHDISRTVRDPLIVWDTTKQYWLILKKGAMVDKMCYRIKYGLPNTESNG